MTQKGQQPRSGDRQTSRVGTRKITEYQKYSDNPDSPVFNPNKFKKLLSLAKNGVSSGLEFGVERAFNKDVRYDLVQTEYELLVDQEYQSYYYSDDQGRLAHVEGWVEISEPYAGQAVSSPVILNTHYLSDAESPLKEGGWIDDARR